MFIFLAALFIAIFYPFFNYCKNFKAIQQTCHKMLAKEIFMCTLIYNNPPPFLSLWTLYKFH